MSGKDRDVLNPGDLVRVNVHLFAQLAGKIGVVVEETTSPTPLRTYKVLVDGYIVNLHRVYLEVVNATR
jgi:protein involved in polysaccharide export with SLBB domain